MGFAFGKAIAFTYAVIVSLVANVVFDFVREPPQATSPEVAAVNATEGQRVRARLPAPGSVSSATTAPTRASPAVAAPASPAKPQPQVSAALAALPQLPPISAVTIPPVETPPMPAVGVGPAHPPAAPVAPTVAPPPPENPRPGPGSGGLY